MDFITSLHPTTIAILSAFFAAIASILARTLLKGMKSQEMLGINFFTMTATLLLFSPLFYKFEASGLTMGLVVLIALIDCFANFFYFKTFEKTEASIATPILSLAPAFTFFFSFLFLGEHVSGYQYAVAFAIIALVIIFSSDFKNFAKFKSSTLIPALTSSFLFGISAIPSKYLLDNLDAVNAPTLYMFRAGFIALFALLIFQFSIKSITIFQYRVIFVRSLFVIAQWVLLYYALTSGSAGVTITLGNITPIFVFLLSILFLRESITWKKTTAAILILALSYFIR